MGSVFKKTVTRPLPPDAEIITRQGVRFARWRDGKGKTRTAPVTTGKDGTERIRDESGTYVARYRDGDDIVVEVSTGCRDKTAAQSVLADLERKAERVRAGLLTPAEARTAEHLATPIAEHFDAYICSSRAAARARCHAPEQRQTYLNRLAADCGFSALADLNREALEQWLAAETKNGRSARSRNTHRADSSPSPTGAPTEHRPAFVESVQGGAEGRREGRPSPPPPVDDRSRACATARRRPPPTPARRHDRAKGQEEGASRRQCPTRSSGAARSGRPRASLDLQDAGSHRAQEERTGDPDRRSTPARWADSYVELDAEDEKNREGNDVVIRADLAEDLRAWLADKLAALQAEALRRGEPIPAGFPATRPSSTCRPASTRFSTAT